MKTWRPDEVFPLRPAIRLPEGLSEEDLFNWLRHVRVEGAPAEIADYCAQDFRRFLYTLGLVADASTMIPNDRRGDCLELGGNPYFTTLLLKQFTRHEWSISNYFGEGHPNGISSQTVDYLEYQPKDQEHALARSIRLQYHHFNIEVDEFPFEDGCFDIVLFCEIIEHLLMDPARVLRQIKRILRPSGRLVLTTPNVSRLENVARMIAGANIYDPYSGYGPYGRHNREYNKHELYLLLKHVGFSIEQMFTADVHHNDSLNYFDLSALKAALKFRETDLGQYIFVVAKVDDCGKDKNPSWLYRSYPPGELSD